VDADAFRKLLPAVAPSALPADPEAEIDPKRALRNILSEAGGAGLAPRQLYDFFGNNVALPALRRLPAFRRFEEELSEAIVRAARA
jgi:hypothetical protein